jgi:AcrR family transcriptional regulator
MVSERQLLRVVANMPRLKPANHPYAHSLAVSTQQRKALEKEHRRRTILEAAESVMQESGLYGLNIDLVAARTELAKGTIYLYFKSKEEILAALTLKARRLLVEAFDQVVSRETDPLSAIRGIIRANYTFTKRTPCITTWFPSTKPTIRSPKPPSCWRPAKPSSTWW